MPSKPLRPCGQQGCPALTDSGYCDKHKRQTQRDYDKQRGTSALRGYGSRWQLYRKMFLREHPMCVMCQQQGRLTPAHHVDHIKAVSGPNDPLFWETSNHQGLCASCHSKKTIREDGGYGRHTPGGM